MVNEGGEELLTVQEAAVVAGMTDAGIRTAILRGKLPCLVKYGRKLVRRSDLDQYKLKTKPGRPRRHSDDTSV